MKALASLALAACAAACTTQPTIERGIPYNLNRAEIADVERGVKSGLTYPSSATVSGLSASLNSKMIVTVCGYLNTKNFYGDFTGPMPFFGVMIQGSIPSFAFGNSGLTPEDKYGIRYACSSAGSPI